MTSLVVSCFGASPLSLTLLHRRLLLHPQLPGSAKGGDCDHLLLASSPLKYINVRAHGGEILIEGTHVESWDMSAGGVDEDYEDGRRCTTQTPTRACFFVERRRM